MHTEPQFTPAGLLEIVPPYAGLACTLNLYTTGAPAVVREALPLAPLLPLSTLMTPVFPEPQPTISDREAIKRMASPMDSGRRLEQSDEERIGAVRRDTSVTPSYSRKTDPRFSIEVMQLAATFNKITKGRTPFITS